MGNEIANPKTQCALSSPERAAHREWIGGRALTLLNHYWRADDPIAMTAAIGADWADVLEGLPQDFIQRACIQYQREEPRRKPTPGAIYGIARAMMPKPQVVRDDRPETREEREAREAAPASVVNPDRKAKAEKIIRDAGMAKAITKGESK